MHVRHVKNVVYFENFNFDPKSNNQLKNETIKYIENVNNNKLKFDQNQTINCKNETIKSKKRRTEGYLMFKVRNFPTNM